MFDDSSCEVEIFPKANPRIKSTCLLIETFLEAVIPRAWEAQKKPKGKKGMLSFVCSFVSEQ
jgi:hypothetical protein